MPGSVIYVVTGKVEVGVKTCLLPAFDTLHYKYIRPECVGLLQVIGLGKLEGPIFVRRRIIIVAADSTIMLAASSKTTVDRVP